MLPLSLAWLFCGNRGQAQSDYSCLARAHGDHPSSHAGSQAVAHPNAGATLARSHRPGSDPHATPEAVADTDSRACPGARDRVRYPAQQGSHACRAIPRQPGSGGSGWLGLVNRGGAAAQRAGVAGGDVA